MNRFLPTGKNSRDVLKVLSGSLFNTFLNFAVSILLARAVSVGVYGQFGTANVVLLVIPMVIDAGLNVSLVKYIGDGKYGRQDILNTILLFKLITGFVLLLPAIFFRVELGEAVFGPGSHPLLFSLVAAGSVIANIAISLQAYSQARNDFVGFTLQVVIPNIAKCLLIFILFAMSKISLFSVIAVTSLSAVFGLLFGLRRYREDLALLFRLPVIVEMFGFAKWIAISGILSALVTRTDMFMLNTYSDKQEVGYYYAAFQLAFVFPLVTMSVTNVLLPGAVRLNEASAQKRYVKKVMKFLPAVFAAAVVVVMLSPVTIPLLFGEKYQTAVPVFSILATIFMLGMIVTPLGLIVFSINRPELQTCMFLVQLMVNVAVDYILVPSQGAIGAAWGTFAAKLTGAVLTLLFIKRYIYHDLTISLLTGKKTPAAGKDRIVI